jgi:Histone methylation protein DOT1
VTQGYIYLDSYTWKSTNIGPDKLQIHPEDPEYEPGEYYIGIYAYKPGLNTFSVLYRQESIPESLNLYDSASGRLETWKYFRFKIEYPGESRIEITVTPGHGYIALYASTNLYFPNENEHTWNSGVYHVDRVTDIDDLVVDVGSYFDPDPYDEILKRNFTRKPSIRETQRLKNITEQTDEPVRFCIDTDDWKYSNQICYIGIKNLTELPLNFEIRKKEVLEEQLLTGDMAQKFDLFKSVFSSVEGSSISQSERKRLNCSGKSEFTYGEIDFVHMAPVFGLCNPRPGEVFWDLGCGAGKCMVAMGLLYPELAKVCGVEYLDKLYESCKNTVDHLNNLNSQLPEFKVFHGDMLKVDWSDADILFSSSICFPNELIEGILEKCHSLKKGARFITLKSFPSNDIFEVKYSIRVKMTWGKTGVYVLEKIN